VRVVADADQSPSSALQLTDAELERELRRIEDQAAALRAELARRGKPPQQGHPLGALTTAPATQPADPEPALKTYHNANEILRDLPVELRPGAAPGKEWDKYNVEKVRTWLSRDPVGHPFDGTLRLRGISVQDAHRTGAKLWHIRLAFEPWDFKYGNMLITQEIRGRAAGEFPIGLVGDEQVARRAEKLKEGNTMRVVGTIHNISLQHLGDGRYTITIHLTQATTLSGGLFPPPASQPAGR
jgi:hypothetical protein